MVNTLKKAFLEPLDEFTPIPFWFWNDTLTEEEISRQINDFKLKGVMGFVIHPRIGIPKDIAYLSDKFMHYVKHAVVEAAKLGMKVVLYDEAMYPSGSAHGMVVKDSPEYASRCLRMLEYTWDGSTDIHPEIEADENILSVQAVEKLSSDTINPNSITSIEWVNGKTNFEAPNSGQWSILFFIESFSGGTIRGIHFGEDDKEPDAPPSGDLLNADAMDKFIHLTYDRYYEVLKEYFGNTIIAMFTDEPSSVGRCCKRNIKPWTIHFLDWYKDNGGNVNELPMLWFNAEGTSDVVRKTFKKAINKKLEVAYYSKISLWCKEHGIALTGHPHESDDIGFLKHFQIPGQDIVWRWVAPEDNKGIEGTHTTMGKCSSDAARHSGSRRNSNECFGCCGPNGIHYAFSADDMKWFMDWLFVRGVNLLYPHAFFYSIDGEKRYGERPPDVGPNNIWWKYYNSISDYMKRMSWLMTDSMNTTSIALLCEEDFLPWQMAKYLFQNQIEFNYLEDNLLVSDACTIANGCISIQKQKYTIILIEDPALLTPALTQKLKAFVSGGGKVVVYNPEAKGLPLDGILQLDSVTSIVKALDSITDREVYLFPANADLRLTHVVKDGIDFYLLVNEGEQTIDGQLHITKTGAVELWNPWKGTCEETVESYTKEHCTVLTICLPRRESIIVCVDSACQSTFPLLKSADKKNTDTLTERPMQLSWNISGIESLTKTNVPLTSWTEWPETEDFSGTLSYDSSFNLEEVSEIKNLSIDFGQVHEIAHLYINGADVGFKLWGPYVFDITPYVKTGHNTITLKVTNSLANKLYHSKITSGLLGPVTLIQE